MKTESYHSNGQKTMPMNYVLEIPDFFHIPYCDGQKTMLIAYALKIPAFSHIPY